MENKSQTIVLSLKYVLLAILTGVLVGIIDTVERTFSWLDNNRRLCRNYELTFDSAEEMVKIAAIRHSSERYTSKRTSAGAAIFDYRMAYTVEMYEVTGFNPTLEDSYSYLKLLMESKAPYKDFEEFDVGAKRYVVGVDQQNRWASFNFSRGRWNSSQATNLNFVKSTTRLPNGTQGYFLISDKNKIYQVDAENQRLSETVHVWDPHVVNVAQYDGGLLFLKDDGVIYRANGQPWEKATTTYSQIVNVPLYDSFEVKK
jgi:hypothetical protein